MALTKEKRQSLIDSFKTHPEDSGSSAIQVALLTERIQVLSEHLSQRRKDFSSRLGLLRMVNKRRRLLSYLKKNDGDRYKKIIQQLDLRK